MIGTKDDGITESVPQAQRVNDCLTSAYRADKNDKYGNLVNISTFLSRLKC